MKRPHAVEVNPGVEGSHCPGWLIGERVLSKSEAWVERAVGAYSHHLSRATPILILHRILRSAYGVGKECAVVFLPKTFLDDYVGEHTQLRFVGFDIRFRPDIFKDDVRCDLLYPKIPYVEDAVAQTGNAGRRKRGLSAGVRVLLDPEGTLRATSS